MSTPAAFAERLVREHAGAIAALSPEHVTAGRRRVAVERMAQLGLPGLRDDYWRYASLRGLDKARLTPARRWNGSYDSAALGLPAPLQNTPRRVFVDGWHVPALAAGAFDARALAFDAPSLADTPADGGALEGPSQRFAWLNEAFVEDGARVRVAAGRETALEVIFASTGTDAGAASYPRLEITLEPDAKLTLIERHLGSSGMGSLVNVAVQVDVGRSAALQHYRVQSCASDVLFLDSLRVQVARPVITAPRCLRSGRSRRVLRRRSRSPDAVRRLACAPWRSRRHARARSRAARGACRARHAQPPVYRAVAGDRSRAACNSEVRIDAGAGGSGSQQSLKGLIGGNADVNLRPQLEILTDDVTASHGATTGALDQNTLFYLLSRGVDPATARLLLEWAFLEDVLAQIELPALRREVEARSIALLGDAPALRELL